MNSKWRILLSCVLLICAIFFLVRMFAFWAESDEILQEFSQPQNLYGNEKSFADEKYIYVINEQIGVVHIFDYNGTFLKRLQLPSKGGTVWATMEKNLKL